MSNLQKDRPTPRRRSWVSEMSARIRKRNQADRAGAVAFTYGFAAYEWEGGRLPEKLMHVRDQLRARYGILLTKEIYHTLIEMIRSGRSVKSDFPAHHEHRCVHDVPFDGRMIRVVYRGRAGGGTSGYIKTVLPPGALANVLPI